MVTATFPGPLPFSAARGALPCHGTSSALELRRARGRAERARRVGRGPLANASATSAGSPSAGAKCRYGAPMSGLVLQPVVRTHPGVRRRHNEDSVLGTPRLVAVADGVGGAAAGEVASRSAIDVLAHLEKCWLSGALPDALERAIRDGNERIAFVAECRPQCAGMGTTVTAVALDDRYVVANIGDSRAYLFRDGALTQVTRDDSLVGHVPRVGVGARRTERPER